MGKPWKELEKKTAEALDGVRINRANDYGVSDVDVIVPDLPFLRIDCKYRTRHAHHSLVEEIRSKYCGEGQYPVLVTKHHSSRREYVTVDLVLFAAILKVYRDIMDGWQPKSITEHGENLLLQNKGEIGSTEATRVDENDESQG